MYSTGENMLDVQKYYKANAENKNGRLTANSLSLCMTKSHTPQKTLFGSGTKHSINRSSI